MVKLKLTEKQKKFCDFYVELGNATKAAAKAGYKQPQVQGSQNLEKLSVKTYINECLEQMKTERTADAQEVIEYLSSVMRGESQSEVVVVVNVGNFQSEERKVQKAPDEKEKLKAAELLGKRYMLFTDKQQVDIQSVSFIDDVPEDDDG